MNKFVNKDKVILIDCDGVVLDWEFAFHTWMDQKGYTRKVDGNLVYNIAKQYDLASNNTGHNLVKDFNQSAAIGFLPPMRDAQHYVKLLAEQHGYRFLCVTSLSTDVCAQELRKRNLVKLFGDIFVDYVFLDTGADKDEVLAELAKEYAGNYWIEDKPENADVGIDVGFNGILMAHGHNLEYIGDATYVKNWKDIYGLITGEQK